jgi:hypothetical protein
LDDRETVEQISENIYMQYFLGYSSFINEKPFDASLFVEIRKRLGLDVINEINDKIISLKTKIQEKASSAQKKESSPPSEKETGGDTASSVPPSPEAPQEVSEEAPAVEHKGRILFDATACPQDIAYPTDLDLLSKARKIAEGLIDQLYVSALHEQKPRTYREKAHKRYLQTAQKKQKPKKEIRRAVGAQLGYLRRDIQIIHKLLDAYEKMPLKKKDLKSFWVIQTLYDQQFQMFTTQTHTIEHRIVSIHQPHVRPIVRGKSQAKVEFGSKIHVSLIDGICFLDELSWDAFNEGSHMEAYVEQYRKRFGFYPREVLADKIYCTRDNRKMLKNKGKGILLRSKPLGRSSAVSIHVSPGERNPIEGKFGQAKTGYGLNRIRARLKETSESWIAGIFLVLNLVKLAGAALPCFIQKIWLRFSAGWFETMVSLVVQHRHYCFCPGKITL